MYSDEDTVEMAAWEDGERHGLSTTVSQAGHQIEEIMFWEGEARGPSKLKKPDGSVEERQFSNGRKNGPAKLMLASGDVAEYIYCDDVVEGQASYTWASGKSNCQFLLSMQLA